MKQKLFKTILIVVLFGCALIAATGQKPKKAPTNLHKIELELFLKEPDKSLCDVTSVPLYVKLTNNEKYPLAIDTLQLTRKIYVRATKSVVNPDGKGASGLQINSDFTSPHFQAQCMYKILKSGESLEAATLLDLKDPELTVSDFLYIQTDYRNQKKETYLGVPTFVGEMRSNELKLDLRKCRQEKSGWRRSRSIGG